jgi:hypothetical protein
MLISQANLHTNFTIKRYFNNLIILSHRFLLEYYVSNMLVWQGPKAHFLYLIKMQCIKLGCLLILGWFKANWTWKVKVIDFTRISSEQTVRTFFKQNFHWTLPWWWHSNTDETHDFKTTRSFNTVDEFDFLSHHSVDISYHVPVIWHLFKVWKLDVSPIFYSQNLCRHLKKV